MLAAMASGQYRVASGAEMKLSTALRVGFVTTVAAVGSTGMLATGGAGGGRGFARGEYINRHNDESSRRRPSDIIDRRWVAQYRVSRQAMHVLARFITACFARWRLRLPARSTRNNLKSSQASNGSDAHPCGARYERGSPAGRHQRAVAIHRSRAWPWPHHSDVAQLTSTDASAASG